MKRKILDAASVFILTLIIALLAIHGITETIGLGSPFSGLVTFILT